MANVQLDFAVEQFKCEMAKNKQDKSNDWKKAYLNKVDIKQQSLNNEKEYKKNA